MTGCPCRLHTRKAHINACRFCIANHPVRLARTDQIPRAGEPVVSGPPEGSDARPGRISRADGTGVPPVSVGSTERPGY